MRPRVNRLFMPSAHAVAFFSVTQTVTVTLLLLPGIRLQINLPELLKIL
jgi:hypothetical protein